MILLVDNYDSFVHNLARYFRRLGHETLVMRNDVVPWEKLEELAVDAVVLSPGPGTPDQAGCCLELVTRWASKLPILGVCLGHQVIGQALGATVVRAPQPIHGRSSLVEHDGVGLFVGLPNPLRVGRYHSLAIDAATMPSCLRVTARTEEGVLMAFEHECWPLYGVQFHPESVLTEHGYEILASFLRHSGLTSSEAPADEVSRVCWGNRTPQSAQPPRASAPSNSPPREARGIGKDALSIELESEQWPEYPVRYRRSVEEP